VTKGDIKEIFARFENLNLRVLIENVSCGQVAFGSWIVRSEPDVLCPIAHGWPCNVYQSTDAVTLFAGIPSMDGERFLAWWDGIDEDAARRLLSEALDELWAERVEDAEAVQAVIEEGVTCGP
jgi:hypothetical protein